MSCNLKGTPFVKFQIYHNIFVPEIIEKVNTQIAGHTYGRLFAVVMMEKHQHKVSQGNNNNTIHLLCSVIHIPIFNMENRF